MKKLMLLFVLGITWYAGKVMAQQAKRSMIFQSAQSFDEDAPVAGDASTRVHIRAARHFSKSFSQTEATWRTTNDTTVARFTSDSVTTFVGYNKSGRWLYTVNCLIENQMPRKIRHEIKSQYYDYRIKQVYKILYPQVDEPVFLVYLADLNGVNRVVRWSTEGTETVKKY